MNNPLPGSLPSDSPALNALAASLERFQFDRIRAKEEEKNSNAHVLIGMAIVLGCIFLIWLVLYLANVGYEHISAYYRGIEAIQQKQLEVLEKILQALHK